MSKPDDSWMEGETIPVFGLTKRQLARALGLELKEIHKLTNDGMPVAEARTLRKAAR